MPPSTPYVPSSESPAEFGVDRHVWMQNLDGHRPVEGRVAAKIHVGHSTSADLLFNSNFGQDSPDPVFQLVYSDGN